MDHPILQFIAASLLTLVAVVGILLATAANVGGGPPAVFRTVRALGFSKAKAQKLTALAFRHLTVPFPSWPFAITGGAQHVNELKQAVLEAKAALSMLLDQEAAAKAAVNGYLKKQAAGTLTEDDKKAQAEADATLETFADRLKAQRKLVAQAERELLDEEKRLADETAALAAQPSTRLAVVKDVADKLAEAPGGGFKSFGEKLQHVIAAGKGNVMPDPRLLAGPTGLGETVAADGGFAVGTDYATGIMEKVYDTGQILGKVKRIPVSSGANSMKLPAIDESSRADGSRSGGVRAYWLEEAGALTASQPKIRQNSLTLKKVGALVYLTDELMQDAPALEAWVMQNLPGELVFKIEDAIVNGDGSGKPLGWNSGDAAISVSKETGQAAATFTYANATKMWSRMWGRSRGNSLWLVDQSVEPQLFQMSLPVGTGGSAVFMPAGGASESPFATLFGRPIVPVEYCAALGTVGDVQLVDPTQYTLIDKGGVQFASSMHVQFLTDQMALRFIMRVDGLPDWNSALTPKSGGPTLSPYVKLATRA